MLRHQLDSVQSEKQQMNAEIRSLGEQLSERDHRAQMSKHTADQLRGEVSDLQM